MLTLGRFRRLAASYGADLQRWPEEARRDAQALLDHSAEAGVLFDEARTLDQAIDQATIREDALLWPPGERDAALDRLRSGVEARLASPAGPGLIAGASHGRKPR